MISKNVSFIISISLVSFFNTVTAFPRDVLQLQKIKRTIISDHRQFYSVKNCRNLALGIGIAALCAHSSVDREIRDWYQGSIRSKSTNSVSKIVKPFGNGKITIPVYLVSSLIGQIGKENDVARFIGDWGSSAARSTIVGAPVVLLLQVGLGASRPYESDARWRPFHDNNGVSGHSFMGAIPFLVAAKLCENRWLKSICYVSSTLTGLSRINDDKHYFNQVVLGWYIAFLSSSAIFKTREDKAIIAPLPSGNGLLLNIQFQK